MIKSIKFTEGFGYVSDCENTQKTLLNKTFKFDKDRINIIFGRNGSGKSTILKTIAGHCFVKDGFIKKQDIKSWNLLSDNDDWFDKLLKKHVGNSSEIEMNGAPLYYHNFKETEHKSSDLGSMMGDMITSFQQEVAYIMERSQRSDGEQKLTQLELVTDALDRMKGMSMEDFIHREEKFIGALGDSCSVGFDENKKEHVALRDYFSKLDGYKEKEVTLLLDEYDENLDVNYAFNVLYDYLPKLQKDFNAQIILTTHNPIVLSDIFYKSDKFNIISLEEDYTEGCRDFLYKIFKPKEQKEEIHE